MTTAIEYEQRVVSALATGLHARLGELAAAGRDPSMLGSPAELADRMLATVPQPHPWDVQIGPFYDTPGLVRLLGISKQAIAERVQRRSLIAATTRQGKLVYPSFQFAGRRVLASVSAIAQLFRDTPVDGWAEASWFTTSAASLDGATPAQWLVAGGDVAPVRDLATDAVHRWSMP